MRWSPEILALDIGAASFVLFYLCGIALFYVVGVRKRTPGGITLVQVLACGVASVLGSSLVFVAAASALLGGN